MSEKDNLQNAEGKIEGEVETTNSEGGTNTIKNTLQEEPTITTTNSQYDIIEEIEASNAEDAEDEANKQRHIISKKDYHVLSLEELVQELKALLQLEKVQTVKSHVDEIKQEFNTKFQAELEEKKAVFLEEEGANEIDFYYYNPVQKEFKLAYKEFRNKLNTYYKNLENSLKENLEKRNAIIKAIKELINTNIDSDINAVYKQFKQLQQDWREAGPIPRDKYNTTWNNYHHYVEYFYDLLHLNRDFRSLDFKHNYDKKLKIIERAEALAEDQDANRAFRELQELHKIWKEDLGPVAKEHREEIWERFKVATKKIHDQRQEYYKNLDVLYEQNLEKKKAIIQKIKEESNVVSPSHKLWQQKIKQVEAFRQEFFTAGKVPIKVNEATWTEFKEAVRAFNKTKNAFYKTLKKEQITNLEKKRELIKIAEENKNNEDFETTTALMKKIQSDWKKIGHVPRKDSDKVWNQFKTACNYYFDRFYASKEEENKEGLAVFDKKKELLDQVKNTTFSGDAKSDIATIKNYILQWKEIGNVPKNKRFIENKFHKTLETLFNQVSVNKTESELLLFETKLAQLNELEDKRKLDNERIFIARKVDEIKSEINLLENNLQFFSNTDKSNPLVSEVYKKIERQKENLNLWEIKLERIKQLY